MNDLNTKLITGQTVAEWNADHCASGYIPFDQIIVSRQEDRTWLVETRFDKRHVGTIRSDVEHSGQWICDIIQPMTARQQNEVAEAIEIIEGKR